MPVAYGKIAPTENARGMALAGNLPGDSNTSFPPTSVPDVLQRDRRRALVLCQWLRAGAGAGEPSPLQYLLRPSTSYLTERLPFETISDIEAKRLAHDKQALIEWLDRGDPRTQYLLIRSSLYELLADDLGSRVVPLLREIGLKRNELTLVEVKGNRPSMGTASAIAPTRR